VQILYTIENVAEVLGTTKDQVRLLVSLRVIPTVCTSPIRFSKEAIDLFVESGGWEKHKHFGTGRRKGIWGE
jgi:hypothetical protein